MNIFILDEDMKKNVQSYVNKHVVKMCLETCQLLSTVYYFTEQDAIAPYKINHPQHPCSLWARESLSNWVWLRKLGLEICKEYTYRYGKKHKCEKIMTDMILPNLKDVGFTEQPRVVGDLELICLDVPYSTVEVYRKYYNTCKRDIFNWQGKCNGRNIPDWIEY